MISTDGLIQAIGSTAEWKSGEIQINSINEWVSRLNSTETLPGMPVGGADGEFTGYNPVELPFYHAVGNTYEAGNSYAGGTFSRWPLGPTGAWKNEWWAAHNYLQYGGVLIIGGTGTIENTAQSASSTALHNTTIPLDVVFSATSDQVSHTSNIASVRKDCIAVCPASGTVGNASVDTSQTADEFNVSVYGNKKHLGINRGIREDEFDDLVTTSLTADVAGCMARTDAVADPWWSPAGFKRGDILGVVRLEDNPMDAQMDLMYDDKINPVVTFPGEGTVLFGDKTLAPNSSTLSRINVSRLFIFLKKTVGAAARDKLFELNDFETRMSFINAVNPLMRRIKAGRGLYDFRVVCDESNNTDSIVDSNQFVADIFVKPAKSINFIRIRFTNKNTGDELQ
jgi:phage tail sheath protein FI